MNSKDVYQSIFRKYLLAFSALAVLTVFAYLNLFYLISSSHKYGKLINLSGKQRMLSQKIALYSKVLLDDNNQRNQEYLINTILMMSEEHNYLRNQELPKQIEDIYKERGLHKKLLDYLELGKRFANNPTKKVSQEIFIISQELLPFLDGVVELHQKEAEKSTETLKEIETYILISALLTLLFEAIFIFKPSLQELKRGSTKDLVIEKQKKEIALSHLLRSISHSWRQTLNKIYLNMEVLKVMNEDPKEEKRNIEKTLDISKDYIINLSKTIEKYIQLFTHSDIIQDFQVKSIIESSINKFKSQSKIEVRGNDFYLNGNPTLLAQCMEILIQNSVDVAKEKEIDGVITILMSDGTILYQDNCGGIQKESIDNIFDPYYTTKFQKAEEGMGLFSFKVIMENHLDGKIGVKNTEDGVEFTLMFNQSKPLEHY
ncbi:MAG: ATP-binding protein [Campylobacterales bacterium]|nr:ATP-binding protein [Campylobacterales bacterium]